MREQLRTTEEEFELAMSVAGSICVRAVKDQQDVCLVAASHGVTAASQPRILDTLARGELAETGQDLSTLAGRAYRLARDTTVLMLVTGSVVPFRALQGAAVHFGPDGPPPAVARSRCRSAAGRLPNSR